jgi:4-hydroxy-tetrahydrodipicolinate synthase
VDGIIACATTVESTSLDDKEYYQLAELILSEARAINPKSIVMLGTTSLNPAITLERNRYAVDEGFDGILLTHPPYIKPDQRSILAFFEEVAAAQPGLPIFLYNIWYRTGGKGMDANTIIKLAEIPNIYGIKDCGVSLEHVDEVINNTDRQKFVYLSGEDSMLFDVLAHGGDGAIYATGHLFGKEMQALIALMKKGEITKALHIHRKLKPLIQALFSEPNPAPLKAALTLLGIPVGDPRSPAILPVTEKTKELLERQLSLRKV